MKFKQEVVVQHAEARRIERFDRRAKRVLLAGLVLFALGIVATYLVVDREDPIHRRHLGGALAGMAIGLGYIVAGPGLMKHGDWARKLAVMVTAVLVLLVGYIFVEGGMHFSAALGPWFGEFGEAGGQARIGGIFLVVGKILGSLVGLGALFYIFLRVLGNLRWLSSREARKICGRHSPLRAYSEKT